MTLSRDDVLEWLNERIGTDVYVLVGCGQGRDFSPALHGRGTLRHGSEIEPNNVEDVLDIAEGHGLDALEELSGSYGVGGSLLTLREFPDLLGRVEDLDVVAGLRIPMLEVELSQNVTLRVLAIRESLPFTEQEGEENDG